VDEITSLRSEIASQEEIQAGVLILIQELEAEKGEIQQEDHLP
jgi:hypothetical protein